ncbi:MULTISPECIES: ABC transporter ATP-binding protein [Micrococcaceae]|uniref:ABC transporter ATP-binding protein n=1 Tax=Micrococcaceae TaxID=1268 RepID=UPI00160A4186|nr:MULTISPECIES: ABC transporter ATP-binding protein [Micrococcaceae]MBB5748463.1 teichoic acid transport system ATP-binding protein [Micrococcus sp. TA1]HRO30937.1 ABC transporter ATP-binding protein [Citricoccus sp.]HRO93644.1 ABC transporter ATP-binding protein [Citricoccus sp.]
MTSAPKKRLEMPEADDDDDEDDLLDPSGDQDTAAAAERAVPPAVDRGENPALVLDGISMTFKVSSTKKELQGRLPWHKRIVYGAVRREPRVSVYALEQFSLVVGTGESLGVVGRNGSGKTTLSRIIAGKLTPTTGQVWARSTPQMLGVSPALVPSISGRQNIILGCLAMGMPRSEVMARLPEIEESAGLGDAIHLPMETYSSGMGGRLRFAIATSKNPDILVLDEALNTGDAQFRDRSKARMEKLREQAGAVVLVSHNAKQITSSCTRVLWLDAGRVIADGETEETMYHYRKYNWLLAKQRLEEAEEFIMGLRRDYRPVEVVRV